MMILKVTQHGEKPEIKVEVPDNYDFMELAKQMNDEKVLVVAIGSSIFHRGMIASVTKEG